MAKFATQMGDPHGDPQTGPQHADPHGFLIWCSFKRHQADVDRRVVGWSAGRHVDRPWGGGGKSRHGLLEKSLFECFWEITISKRALAYKILQTESKPNRSQPFYSGCICCR